MAAMDNDFPAVGTLSKPSPDSRELPLGWHTEFDPGWKAWYYVNEPEGFSQWTHPEDDSTRMNAVARAVSSQPEPMNAVAPPGMAPRAGPPGHQGPPPNMASKSQQAMRALQQRHRQLRQREMALQRAADNLTARNQDAQQGHQRKELALAAERYRGQRQLLEAEWRLKREERGLRAERDSQRRAEIERQMARDRQTIQRLQQSKAERDRAAHMLKTERTRAQAEQTAQMQRQEGQYRRQTSNLIAQRIRERQMRQSESLLQMTFGARMSGSRLRALAGQLSLYAAQTKLGIREAFERMMQRRLQRDIMWSEADLASFESGLNSWALQRGYERDRFADQYYMQRELDGAYADSYWTNYYNSNAFMWPDADYGSLGSYGNEFYWNDPLLSGDPFDFNSYGSVYDFSPYDDFGYGNRSFDYGSSFYDDPLYQDCNGLEADTFGSGGFDDFSPFGGSFYNDSMYSPGYLDMDYGYGMDPYDSFGSPGMGSRDFGDFGYSPYSPGYY